MHDKLDQRKLYKVNLIVTMRAHDPEGALLIAQSTAKNTLAPHGHFVGDCEGRILPHRPLICRLCGGQLTLVTLHLTRELFREEVPFHNVCWVEWKNGDRNER